MDMENLDKITVVIRSVGERTEGLCKNLIQEQGIDKKNIFIVKERPFSKAMRVAYQMGINNQLPWTYCVDADVLLGKDSIKKMLSIVEKEPENTLGISGEVLDKLLGKKRTAGNHFFRTKFLNNMIEEMESYKNEDIRPESSTIKKLIKNGFQFKKIELLVGLHDFEQQYYDIARKTFTHLKKHSEHIGEMYSFWREASKVDKDFQAALYGLSRSIMYDGNVKINANDFDRLHSDVTKKYGTKDNSLSSFEIQTINDVSETMEDEKFYYEPDEGMKTRFEKIYRQEFNNRSYSTILKNLIGRVIKDYR